MINDHKTQGKCKVKLTVIINNFSSKDSEESQSMYSHSDNIKVIIGTDTNKIIEDLLDSFLHRRINERKWIFFFDSIDSLYYKLHKISLNRSGSYIDSPKWLKSNNKKATINPKNNDNKCFQYAIAVALNHEQIKNHPERISNIKPFIDQYNWKEINFPSHKKDWNEFGKNSKTIAYAIAYAMQ